jgi:putative ABC transport system permease protein
MGGVIAMMALGVGGIGILNLMLATVSSRIREIGVRKSLGASQACILSQFLTEAATISVAGTLLGLAIGTAPLLIPKGILPVTPTLSMTEILVAGCLGAFTGLAAGWYPAFRASRYSPVEALRHG